jgi:hypothetical protein
MCQEIFNFSVNIISTLILKNSLYIWLSWRLFSFRGNIINRLVFLFSGGKDTKFNVIQDHIMISTYVNHNNCYYLSCKFHLKCHDQFEGFLGVVCFYCNKAKLQIIAIWLHYKSWYLGLVVVVCNRIGVIMTHGSYSDFSFDVILLREIKTHKTNQQQCI